MTYLRSFLSICLLLLAALSLTACGGDSSDKAKPPPTVYLVTHYSHDMTVLNTYRTTHFYSSEGCAFYQPLNHKSGEQYPMICGNVSAERETEPDVVAKPASASNANNGQLPTIYIVKHLKPNGEVFRTMKTTHFYSSRGCAFFQPHNHQSGDIYPMICGDVVVEKEPQ